MVNEKFFKSKKYDFMKSQQRDSSKNLDSLRVKTKKACKNCRKISLGK